MKKKNIIEEEINTVMLEDEVREKIYELIDTVLQIFEDKLRLPIAIWKDWDEIKKEIKTQIQKQYQDDGKKGGQNDN